MDHASLKAEFLQETAPLIADLEQKLLAIERAAALLEDEWRAALSLLHTVKGNCGMMRYEAAQQLAQVMEDRATLARAAAPQVQEHAASALLGAIDLLARSLADPDEGHDSLRSAASALARGDAVDEADGVPTEARLRAYLPFASGGPSSVRIGADKLDRLLEAVGELATQHSLTALCVSVLAGEIGASDARVTGGIEAVDELGKTVAELRRRVMEARLLPLSLVLSRFQRLVRDLSQTTGKEVVLRVEGGDTVVDKTLVDGLGEPLLHIIRNAVDHGIEAPAAREAAGKSRRGTILIRARQGEGELSVTVSDDGRGLDRDALLRRAAAIGIDAAGWSDHSVFELIFSPQLSTAERVTELSGRGVGLDAARATIEKLGGAVHVRSRAGAGTEFHIHVPLLVVVRRTLLVECNGETFALPLSAVSETFRPELDAAVSEDGVRSLVDRRGRAVPVVTLADRIASAPAEAGVAAPLGVVIEDSGGACCLLVDRLAGQHDVVVKELEPIVGAPRGIAGAAILGDGSVVMVLDPRWLTRGVA